MDYTKNQRVKQNPVLAWRQAMADQNSAPQADEGTVSAAMELAAEYADEQVLGEAK